ncbi:MAG: hypothetical protein Q9211_001136 [Gyalolechia sp. 1 TL-2023]
MSSQFSEIADIPREFLREGTQFVNRCAKPDKREFIKISQAVGVGFVVMGAIGYVVKLTPVVQYISIRGLGALLSGPPSMHFAVIQRPHPLV